MDIKRKTLRSDCIFFFEGKETWKWYRRRRGKSPVTSPPTHFTRLILNEACNLTVIPRILIFLHASFHLNALWLGFTQSLYSACLSLSLRSSLSFSLHLMAFLSPTSFYIQSVQYVLLRREMNTYKWANTVLPYEIVWSVDALKLKPTCHDVLSSLYSSPSSCCTTRWRYRFI